MGNATTHGMSKTRLYRIHRTMQQRCNSSSFDSYRYYGAKGISVCDEWAGNFIPFMEWSLLNGYSDKLTIDRIDPVGNYTPSNCRWVSQHQQILNQDRNKHRAISDKYIREKNGRWHLVITKRTDCKSKVLYSSCFLTREEAVNARDTFLCTGKKHIIMKHEFGTTNKNDFSISKKRKLLQKNRYIKRQEKKLQKTLDK